MQIVALPHRIVGVLQVQVAQRRWLAATISLIQCRQLADQNAARPAIKHDVVHGQQQDVILRRQSQQLRPYQRTCFQVKRRLRFRGSELLSFLFAFSELAEIHNWQWNVDRRSHHLGWLTVDTGKSSSEYFVPPHNLVEAVP